jgi:hypothetical protein
MKRFCFTFYLTLSVLSLLASQERKVLILGIDGVRADALQIAKTPHLDSLAANGTFTYNAWCLGITVSGPSWSTIMTGVWYQKHGVTDNSYVGSRYNEYPYFPTLAKQLKPNLNCVQITEWNPMSDLVYNDGWNKKIKTGDDGNNYLTAKIAKPYLRDSADLDVLFVYLDKCDITGHNSGFSPQNPAYIRAIESCDSSVGEMLNDLRSRPNYANENWLILVTTDHGGIGKGHGGNTDDERRIWWIGSGKSIAKQQIFAPDPGSYRKPSGVDTNLLKLSPVQADIAVTALHHLLYDMGIQPEEQVQWKLDGKSWLPRFTNLAQPPSSPSHIKIYPNPSNGLFTIWFENDTRETVEYSVTDLNGKLIQEGISITPNKLTINMEQQPKGMYLVNMIIGAKTVSHKIHID